MFVVGYTPAAASSAKSLWALLTSSVILRKPKRSARTDWPPVADGPPGASPPAGASMTDYIANGWARGANIQSLDSFTTNGLPAATALVQSQSGYVQLVAIRFAPDTVYRFVMAAPMNAMRQGASDLSQVVKSFRKVSAAEARKLKPRRVQPVTVKRGQSLSDFARRMPFEDYQLDRFLALNGLAPDATLQAGQTVKLIVE